MHIDFSSLLAARKPNSPLQNMFIAMGVVAIIGVLLALGALVNNYVDNDHSTTFLSGTLVLGYLLLWPCTIWLLARRRQRNMHALQQFAYDNAYTFTGSAELPSDAYLLPNSDMLSGAFRLQYSISNQQNTFLLYALRGVVQSRRLNRKGFLDATVLRVTKRAIPSGAAEASSMLVETGGEYTYVARLATVTDRSGIQEFFKVAGLLD